jgi:hypothetical protein
MAIATIFATLQISKAVGDDGNDFTPEVRFVVGLTRYRRFADFSPVTEQRAGPDIATWTNSNQHDVMISNRHTP